MDTTVTLRTGDPAPDFLLRDHSNRPVRLSDHLGKRVLLSWHPLAWTNICADQMKALEAARDELEELNTVAIGLSVDTVPSKSAWAKKLGIEHTPLLSDFWPHGEIARGYGIFLEEKGFSARANFIVSESGGLVFIKMYEIPELPDLAEVLAALRG